MPNLNLSSSLSWLRQNFNYSTYEEAVNIMGFYGEDVATVNYVNWLTMARAGIVGLKNYSPDTKEWTQAHARARYVILQVNCLRFTT